MTRRGTQESRKWRIILGVMLSVVTFGIAVPATFVMAAKWLDRVINLPGILTSDIATILAAFCVFVGLVWMTWSYSYLVFVGKGSPVEAFGIALEPTQQLVTFGPYAYLRHPMIFGLIWLFLGVALYIRSLGAIILVPVIAFLAWAHLRIWEEFGLEQRFGEEYVRYRNHVRALIPHLAPYIPE
ncbi:MAG: isoprenylcysteine carboxylmethyltransferase family protein [Armatimonadota bacterium]|nr:isoprenylcysteine carboxylmethyltransferase family protein [Armatimonadota bacterium]